MVYVYPWLGVFVGLRTRVRIEVFVRSCVYVTVFTAKHYFC